MVLLVSTGFIVVSVEVLSEVPDTFFVELHAEMATITEPAKARLKINFFIGFFLVFILDNQQDQFIKVLNNLKPDSYKSKKGSPVLSGKPLKKLIIIYFFGIKTPFIT